MPNARAPQAGRLSVRIGTLSLPAGSIARAERVGAALRAELGRLLSERMARGGRMTSLDRSALAAAVSGFDQHERPERSGRRLARAVADALFGAERRERR